MGYISGFGESQKLKNKEKKREIQRTESYSKGGQNSIFVPTRSSCPVAIEKLGILVTTKQQLARARAVTPL